MATLYTPPAGNSPAGTQLAQTSTQQGVIAANPTPQQTADMTTSVAGGNTLTPDQVNAVTNAFGTVSAEQTRQNTPQVRQQYIDNTDLGAAQSNYSDLASKLASYDQLVLQPQFEGTNPGTPSDVPNNPFVSFNGISALTPDTAALPADKGIYNSNPEYALTAQTNQSDNILGLLSTLNKVISNANQVGTNRYTSTMKSLADTLSPLKDLLDMNTQLEMKKAELSNNTYLKELELGLVNPDGSSTSAADSSTTDTTSGDINTQRKAIQDKYNSLPPQSPVASKLLDNWNKSHPGVPLFPTPPTAQEAPKVNATIDALKQINQALNLLDTAHVGSAAIGDKALLEALPNNIGTNFVDKNTAALNSLLVPAQFGGEKALIGGRLTGQLTQLTQQGFPTITTDKDTLKSMLVNMQNNAEQDLQEYANSRGYLNYTDLPGFQFSQTQPNPYSGGSTRSQTSNGFIIKAVSP